MQQFHFGLFILEIHAYVRNEYMQELLLQKMETTQKPISNTIYA